MIPKKLKIGGITYEVRLATNWFESDGSDGETFYNREQGHVIYINSRLSDESREITLIHEILHCLNSTIDHDFLDSLSEQLYQVLKDNHLNFK